MYSLQTSEDSLSQGTGAVSELSDEAAPILGRRAIREKINVSSKYSDDSDSDLDLYRVSKSVAQYIFTQSSAIIICINSNEYASFRYLYPLDSVLLRQNLAKISGRNSFQTR